ncbi:MAG: hypothetical protein ACRYFX_14140 [Janthinobacterium lividum]
MTAATDESDSFSGCLGRLLPLGGLLALGAIVRLLPLWVVEVGGLLLLALLLVGLAKSKPFKPLATGYLLFFENRVEVRVSGNSQQWLLDSTTRVSLRYQGFRREHLGGRMWATGTNNFLTLPDGAEHAFYVADAAVQTALRRELRHWYQRKVQLKEYRWGSRTILLYKNPSYEQLQEFKREFGISLYS